jgi:ribosomal protein S6--L-glutamate ligase
MKGAVISLGSKSSVMVAEEMQNYFDEVDMIQLKEIEVVLGKDAGMFYQGKEFPHYDCIYVKGSFRYANLLRSIASMLEGKGIYMPIPANSFTVVHNKLLTHLALEQKGIPMPQTYVSPNADTARELLKRVKYPIVMKFPEGTQGKGVMFADSFASASSVLDALGALNQPFIIQEYVDSGGTDVRVLVIGDNAVAGMRRRAQTEEKRANIHAGGTGEAVTLNRETFNLAVKTAKALGVDVCGVDILEGPLGPVVIEANVSPGLQGLSKVATVNVAKEIAKHFARKTKEMMVKKRAVDSKEVMKELKLDDVSNGSDKQEIITSLSFKGERILLPQLVTKLSEFHEVGNYVIKVKKGKLEIEEFDV